MEKNWHSISLADVFDLTESAAHGLTSLEAEKRKKELGANILPEEKPYSRMRLFLRQFHSPLIYILLITAGISSFLTHYSDTIFILAVLVINTTVGFYQENKANRSLRVLKRMVRITARVLRDGSLKEIDSEDLVVGDAVALKAGDKVPADARIIESRGLRVNEASLTGESQAVEKKPVDALSADMPLSERANMVFMGSIVEEGRAKVLVMAIGLATHIGEIVSMLKETKELHTPLQQKIATLSKITAGFILSVIGLIIAIGYARGESFGDIFIASLALAVSAIPEGLLPGITVILVLGMRRILKQKGLVRRLVATETLGSVTVICTDKTGTLTEGNMRVSHVVTSRGEVAGDGLNGLTAREGAGNVEPHVLALRIAVLASDAFVENPETESEEPVLRGRPTEQAIILAGMKAGLHKHELEKRYPVLDRISFASDLKYAATLHQDDERTNSLYVVGAPEEIVSRAVAIDHGGEKLKFGAPEADALMERFESLTKQGLRVLACAEKRHDPGTPYHNIGELIYGLTLVGFIALSDPLRPDARASIEITKRAGIRTVIITGDHRLTARTIAEEVGLRVGEENIVEGKDIESMGEMELKERAKRIAVYARVSPRHKLRIVQALQANGEIVAMLGDGVNDAPALQSANIGVAVGSGADVAKEVADLVLLDDNFHTVVSAIEQGRVMFENIRKVFVYLVADDFSELFLFLSSMAMGLPLPLLPVHILWINLIEDGSPGIALTTEQETRGVMEEKPRDPKEAILNKPLKLWMAAIFFITGAAAFLSFYFLWRFTGDLEKTRTMVFALMCVDSLAFALSVRSLRRSIFRRDIFSNRYLVGAVTVGTVLLMGAIYFEPLQRLLHTRALGMGEWLTILAVSVVEILLIELSKKTVLGPKK